MENLANLNKKERLDLQKLIRESDCEDNTQHIRSVKHSVLIRDDIRIMEQLKKNEASLRESNPESFNEMCMQKCSFLFENYSDLFKRLIKDELNLMIMTKLLTILKLIEDGRVDQHEGSVMVGKVLKELYIDSAIKHGENLDKIHQAEENPPPIQGKKISWKEFKMHSN